MRLILAAAIGVLCWEAWDRWRMRRWEREWRAEHAACDPDPADGVQPADPWPPSWREDWSDPAMDVYDTLPNMGYPVTGTVSTIGIDPPYGPALRAAYEAHETAIRRSAQSSIVTTEGMS